LSEGDFVSRHADFVPFVRAQILLDGLA
jgi:hypothetical protein